MHKLPPGYMQIFYETQKVLQCELLQYTPLNLNHHLQAAGVGCYVGGAWVYSLSYADDMVLLAPRLTALHTLLEVCLAYAGPHDIVYNTTKTVCMVVRPKHSQGQLSTRVGLANEELSFFEEFRHLYDIS